MAKGFTKQGELQKDYDVKVKENHEKERQKAIENIKYQFSKNRGKKPLDFYYRVYFSSIHTLHLSYF